MVFQSLALFDHRTVGQNIEFAMKMKGVGPRSGDAARSISCASCGCPRPTIPVP
jgi:ABC-type Fe3+/spermidine/putrescine transport system ATPase subunit